MELLIQVGAGVNLGDKKGGTPLIWAAKKGNTEVMELLIQAKADFNLGDEDGETPLIWAAQKGNTEVMELLIQAGADVNLGDEDGETPLIWAAQEGKTGLVEILLGAGADANQACARGTTALCRASMCSAAVVKMLLDADGDANRADSLGRTPLMYAVSSGEREVVTQLLHAGVNVNQAENGYGFSPLMLSLSSEWTEIMENLLKKGADMNQGDKQSRTVVDWALSFGTDDQLRVLIDHRQRNRALDNRPSPLIQAMAGDHDAVDHEKLWDLVDAGEDVNARSAFGRNVLSYAVSRCDMKSVDILLLSGAQLDDEVRNRLSSKLARYEGEIRDVYHPKRKNIKERFKGLERLKTKLEDCTAKPDKTSPSLEACRWVYKKHPVVLVGAVENYGVRTLRSHGFRLDQAVDKFGHGVLWHSFVHEKLGLVVALREAGVRLPNNSMASNSSCSPASFVRNLMKSLESELVHALKTAKNELHVVYEYWIRVLLRGGANISAKDENGNSALMVAAESGEAESDTWLLLLLEGGAYVHNKNFRGLSALNLALSPNVAHGRRKSELLLAAGAEADSAEAKRILAELEGNPDAEEPQSLLRCCRQVVRKALIAGCAPNVWCGVHSLVAQGRLPVNTVPSFLTYDVSFILKR